MATFNRPARTIVTPARNRDSSDDEDDETVAPVTAAAAMDDGCDSSDVAEADDEDAKAASTLRAQTKAQTKAWMKNLVRGATVQLIEKDESIQGMKKFAEQKQKKLDKNIGKPAIILSQKGSQSRYDVKLESGKQIESVPWYNLMYDPTISKDIFNMDESDSEINLNFDDIDEEDMMKKMEASDNQRVHDLLQQIKEQNKILRDLKPNSDREKRFMMHRLLAYDEAKQMTENGGSYLFAPGSSALAAIGVEESKSDSS